MNYCQRCGRQIDEDKKHCPYCGVLQERDLDEEKKPCKKCARSIPVNANYCPYCGHDQAIFEYHETPLDTPDETKPKPKPESEAEKIIAQDANDLKMLIDQIRAENEKFVKEREQLAKKAEREHTFGKNENQNPNLIVSTRLMLKDAFKTDKRMGRADFWWGFLGMNLIFVALMLLDSVIYDLWYRLAPKSAELGLSISVYVSFFAVFLVIFTGLVRRFRDAEIPLMYLILMLTGIGELICLLLAIKPQQVTNFDYSFTSLSQKRQNDKNKSDR